MFVAVLIVLAVLGATVWSVQSYPYARDRTRSHRVTGALLGCSMLALVAAVLWAAGTSP